MRIWQLVKLYLQKPNATLNKSHPLCILHFSALLFLIFCQSFSEWFLRKEIKACP